MAWLRHRPRGLAVVPVRDGNEWFTPAAARRKAEELGWEHEPHVVRFDGNNLHEVLDAMERAYSRESREPLSLASV